MTDPARLARKSPVSACEGLLAIGPLVVPAGEDLETVARRAMAQPSTRVIGVVDGSGRLVGILPILRVIEDVVARVAPETLLSDIHDVEDVARFSHAVEARTASDAMMPPASVVPTATVDDAFRLMHQRRLSGLYIVDGEGRPTGYLDMLELAVRYLEALDTEGGDERPERPGTGR